MRPDRPDLLRPSRLLLLLSLAPLLTACATTGVPAPPPPAPVVAAPAQPVPELSNALHWMRDSAEYRALLHQTYRAAATRIGELAAGRQPFTWAVSIDADETILDNSPYLKQQEARGEALTDSSWYAWVAQKAAPTLPGAVEFLEAVRGLGGKIVVVTNRSEVLCLATEDNLSAQRVPFDAVLCRPKDGSRAKEPRWQAIQQGTATKYLPPLEILLWVGDNIGDFPGATQNLRNASPAFLDRFGDRWFIVPNPAYGSWKGNPQR